jgi:hypothetical protein
LLVIPFRRHEKLESENTELKQGKLSIEGIPIEMTKGNRYTCQLRISDTSSKASAKNVRVEVTEMETSPQSLPDKIPHWPLRLLSEKEDNDILTMNPGDELTFDLFEATIYQTSYRDDPHYTVSINFSEAEKSAVFEPNKSYLLKIKVTATDFPPTKADLSLNFAGHQSKWNLILNSIKP